MQDSITRKEAFFWALQGLCSMHRKPFSIELAHQQFATPHTVASLLRAIHDYGFDGASYKHKLEKFYRESFPLIAWLEAKPGAEPVAGASTLVLFPALILQVDSTNVLLIEFGDGTPSTVSLEDLALRYKGFITRVTPIADASLDLDSEELARQSCKFGFSWFVPELLKDKKLWQEILLASLAIQLIALATPLFTQAIVENVEVHRTESTLIVIAIGMLVFMLFSCGLSWLRQYLVLHTGNRIDAVLGASVFERLFKLPPMYFQHRPTGVIAARLHGVETIREFIASTAVSLVLGLPFLLIFIAIMFYYNVVLTPFNQSSGVA